MNTHNEDSHIKKNYDLFIQQVDLLKSKLREIDPQCRFPYGPRRYNDQVLQWNQSFIPSIWQNIDGFKNEVGYTFRCYRDKETFLFIINYHIYLEGFGEDNKYREDFKKAMHNEILYGYAFSSTLRLFKQNLQYPYMLIATEFPLDEKSGAKAFKYYSDIFPLNDAIAKRIRWFCKENRFKR